MQTSCRFEYKRSHKISTIIEEGEQDESFINENHDNLCAIFNVKGSVKEEEEKKKVIIPNITQYELMEAEYKRQ